jgi:RecB family exonuclease
MAPDPAEAAGPDELWVGLARLDPAEWPAAIPPDYLAPWDALRRRRETWRALREARPGPAAVARWLKARPGHQGAPLLSPSFLAGFAECPLAFWFGEALGLGSAGAPLEEWPPASEGNLQHRVLEAFFRPRLGPDGTPGPPWPGTAEEEACRAELLKLAEAEAERASREPLGRLPLWRLRQENLPDIFLGWLKRELAEDRPEDEVRPWFLEWSFGPRPRDAAPPWPLMVGESETIYFQGRADRLDRTGRGLWIRDYKRRDSDGLKLKPGQPPPAKSWPLLIYALAAGAHFGLPADCSFEILDSAAGAARRLGLPSDHPALDPDPAARVRAAEEGAFSFPRLLAETWAGIKAGVFRPEGENQCAYCLWGRLCPRADGEASREAS